MRNLFDIKGRVIVITGGTGVLGTSMTEYLAEQGAKMVVLGRNKEKGEGIVNSIKEKGGEGIFLQSDVNDIEVVKQNAEDVVAKYGRIDVLINGAGGNMPGATIGPDKNIFDLDINAFTTVVDLNLMGTVIPTLAFAKVMAEQKQGNIINISSESALRPLTRVVGYGTAKAAVTNFTKYLAIELAQKFGQGMRVNAIAPGPTMRAERQPQAHFDRQRAACILGRGGDPDDVTAALLYLRGAKAVTGQMIAVDGGQHLQWQTRDILNAG